MEGNLEHEEGEGAAKKACQFSTVVKCGWFRRTPVDLESECLAGSLSQHLTRLHSSAMGLCSFWDLETFLHTHMVVEIPQSCRTVTLSSCSLPHAPCPLALDRQFTSQQPVLPGLL